jgi:YidC/Oxa1 family membrane protein insertase
MDRRTIIAIVLSALVLILVPLLFERLGLIPKRPVSKTAVSDSVAVPLTGDTTGTATPTADPGTLASGGPGAAANGSSGALAPLSGGPGRIVRLANRDLEATFDSRGARLSTVRLPHFRGQEADSSVALASFPILELDLGSDAGNQPLANFVYEVAESSDTSGQNRAVRFVLADSAGLRVSQTYRLAPEGYAIDVDIRMDGILPRGWSEYQLTLRSWPLATERNVSEDLNNLQAVALVGNEVKRARFKDLRQSRRYDGAIRWVAVRSKYFTAAAIPIDASTKMAAAFVPDPAPGAPPPPVGAPPQRVAANLVLPVPPPGTVHTIRMYVGPNDYWGLTKVGGNLQDIVDLGWRWLLPFSRAILSVMIFLERFIPNWGLVILVLSAMVKIVFHPLTAASMRSMRSMQRIQPEIERLRKKYEKEPQKMNQAVFDLYKQNKINPLGGCLPLVIQMPVLFALYQVFLHAIELRQSPFVAWISDLSAPDQLFSVFGFPIRVLPLIMYGSAVLQQRMTPTDPRQVMTMHLMNVFLLVIFYNLPSGLVLYWTVTNLLTALQQYLVNRGERPLVVQAA